MSDEPVKCGRCGKTGITLGIMCGHCGEPPTPNAELETLRAENERLKKDFTEKFQIAAECQRLRELVTLQAGELEAAQSALKVARDALDCLVKLDDQMNDPEYEDSGTFAGAYYCYHKGESKTWDNARVALSTIDAALKGETE